MKIALKANSNINKNLSKQPEKVSRPYKIKATIRGKERIWLEISYHYKNATVSIWKAARKEELDLTPNDYSTIR